MSEQQTSQQQTSHLSDFALDALATAGRGSDPLADPHAATCARCQTRARELAAAREAFLDSPAAAHLETRLLARLREQRARPSFFARFRFPLLAAAGTTAAALAAVLIVGPALWADPAPAEGPGARMSGVKGPLAVESFVQRDGRVVRTASDDVLAPGDAIGFRLTAAADGYAALFGTGDGTAVAVAPLDGGSAVAVKAGVVATLPASAVLDATPGEERFLAVHCPEPFAAADLATVLQPWAQGAGDAARAVRQVAGDGCTVRALVFSKRGE